MDQYGASYSGGADFGSGTGRISEGRAAATLGGASGGGEERGGGHDQTGGGTGKALKRGGACLYCRKRKLRCTGVAPCPTCIKHNIDCTFDEPGKPKSRVKVLEDKIASLEAVLVAQMNPNGPSASDQPVRDTVKDRTSSFSSFPYPSRPPKPTSRGPRVDEQQAFSLALQELFKGDPSIDGGMADTSDIRGQTGFSFLQDWSSLLPAAPPPAQPLDSNVHANWYPPFGPLPPVSPSTHLQHSSSSSSSFPQPDASFWNHDGSSQTTSPPLDLNLFSTLSTQPSLNFGLPGFDTSSHQQQTQSQLQLQSQPQPQPQPPSFPPHPSSFPIPRDWESGDGTQLPPGMREHLLGLFLQRRRQLCVINHVGRFVESLDGPPESRPAPALLFAIYTAASRFSPNAEIRDLEDTFLALTRRHLEIGIGSYSDQRLVHCIQGSTLLSSYFYSKSRYLEGWVQGGTSLRISQACRLHRLSAAEISFAMRCFAEGAPVQSEPAAWSSTWPSVALSPPKDGVELGERVWAFWVAFILDQTGSIATGRSGLDHAQIETPFPRPLEDYYRGILQESDFRCISDLYDSNPTPRSSESLGAILLDLRDEYANRPRPVRLPTLSSSNSPESTTSSPSNSSSPKDEPHSRPQRSHSIPTGSSNTTSSSPLPPLAARPLPDELLRVERALSAFASSLPAQYRDVAKPHLGGIPAWQNDTGLHSDQGTYDGPSPLNVKVGISPSLFSLHAIICTSFVLLFTEASRYDSSYRIKVSKAATAAVQLIQVIVDVDFGQLDIFLIVLWRLQARALMEEIKTLRREGQTDRASALIVDIEVLVLAMRRMGQVWQFGEQMASTIIQRMQALEVADPSAVEPSTNDVPG
ncbi:hypothetical protein BDY24DRAFT_414809 [Mrakia frigida]|uniref:uncharacterized protein n=1 Tax=Mrakia frigida TaxID=29902 RepID=UPI003FCC0CB4